MTFNPASNFDVQAIRRDFPILNRIVRGKPLVYLDNAATSQKPTAVLDAIDNYYRQYNANVHRGVHLLSQEATDAFEKARERMRQFVNAASSQEIIFVRGATEGINLVAHSFGLDYINAGDEILVSAMEHHSNIVPWQLLCQRNGAKLRVIPMNDAGELDIEAYLELLSPKVKLVAVTHVSNALGTINPVKRIIDAAHAVGARVLVDGAQAVPHLAVDVQALGCDFYVLSGHKMYGPTGIGVLYGKKALLTAMSPYQGGGDMIRTVSFEQTEYNDLPYKFEAGTPDIAGAIGLGAAAEYLNHIGLDNIARYEHMLLKYGTAKLRDVPGLRFIGTARDKASVISFLLDGVHAHDIGTILDEDGIAIRAGHHCAMPVMERYGIAATTRASLAFYNTTAEIDALVNGLAKVREVFG